jgi:hypothetical protein
MPSVVAYTCNPSTQEVEAKGSHIKGSLDYTGRRKGKRKEKESIKDQKMTIYNVSELQKCQYYKRQRGSTSLKETKET